MSAAPNPDQPLRYHGQRIVRTLGSILITSCVLMLVLGVTALSGRLRADGHEIEFLMFWTWCFLLGVASFLVAAFDMASLRRLSRESRRRLYEEKFLNKDFLEKLRRTADDHGKRT